MKSKRHLQWALSIPASLLLLQTLFFKFTGAEESIAIFSTLGMEPVGRYASGIIELIAGILLLIPAYRIYGSLLGLAVISGAIFFHLSVLGIEINGDGGLLFSYALIVFLCCLSLVLIDHSKIPFPRRKDR